MMKLDMDSLLIPIRVHHFMALPARNHHMEVAEAAEMGKLSTLLTIITCLSIPHPNLLPRQGLKTITPRINHPHILQQARCNRRVVFQELVSEAASTQPVVAMKQILSVVIPEHAAPDDLEPTTITGEQGEDDDQIGPSKELEVEDENTESQPANEQMPPPARAPPTGPANSKFSFAFKATTKTPVAMPKPEISQKFSAAPKKELQQPLDDRERNLPRDTPRGPASSRSRADARDDYHHNRHHQPERPRTRLVKKIHKKLKPKPELPDDLKVSDSVYFRKPGNESVIGSGTYGKVFKGLNVYTKKLVALKKIRMEGERDGFPVTAVREIKLLQSLKHENIVDLREVMVEKNDCYMVFEYLAHDLTGLLNHPSFKLEPAHRKHLAMQMFEGLDYLHKRGVLHRDIKAANILVSSDGVLKLADFGLARFYAKRHQYDYTNRVVTIWYRSPELLYGETRYGAACDIWSAACVLVEIFTRHAIFPGDGGEINQLEKIYAVLGTPNKTEWPGLVDMPWFELLRPGYRKPNLFAEKYKEKVPAAAFELLASTFQYDPVKRPSAAEVLEHPYFTTEQPSPRQAIELQAVEGDWHEFESKALRREKEKQDREARKAREAANREKEKKRPPSTHDIQPDTKRPHLDERPSESNTMPPAEADPSKIVVN
ncbi:putative ctd kinase subunit alpha protein [Eutypa lata UCREL1]|uniref:cyclin-dependent kinase n=1 Tax=Eutypa lata (strain UCR-EL1) TaxID=1287681 RepID=M7T482_EUTLA|nr:putative ctd kinase subunit alpha protein [Eutypa lata UCREL1]